MKSAPTTEMPNQYYEEYTVPRHAPKSVGAAARRRVLANIQAAFREILCTERLPECCYPIKPIESAQFFSWRVFCRLRHSFLLHIAAQFAEIRLPYCRLSA